MLSSSFPPSLPSQDELEKIRDLKKKIVAQGEHSKKVFERTEMKIQILKETVTDQRETIEKQNSKISELEEKSQSQDRKITLSSQLKISLLSLSLLNKLRINVPSSLFL